MYALATRIKINMIAKKPSQNTLRKAIELVLANQKQT
jgi:hypothetical protein